MLGICIWNVSHHRNRQSRISSTALLKLEDRSGSTLITYPFKRKQNTRFRWCVPSKKIYIEEKRTVMESRGANRLTNRGAQGRTRRLKFAIHFFVRRWEAKGSCCSVSICVLLFSRRIVVMSQSCRHQSGFSRGAPVSERHYLNKFYRHKSFSMLCRALCNVLYAIVLMEHSRGLFFPRFLDV